MEILIPSNTWRTTTTIDGVKYILSDADNTASVTRYTKDFPTKIIIPATITYNDKAYTVTSIGGGAFYKCHSLTTIEIPASVITIGYNAFSGCSSLTSVLFLGDRPKAGSYVFYSTLNLSEIYFLEGTEGWEDGGTWNGKTTKVYKETPEIPEIHGEIQDGKLVLTFTGYLYHSPKGVNEWLYLTDKSPYTVEMTEKRNFFRACSEKLR